MPQNKELWSYNENEQVWVGKYQNSQNISHWHSDCELIYVLNGKINIMHDKILYTLNEGDSFFIESEKIHNMHATYNDTIIMIIVFDYELVRKIMDSYELISPVLSNDYGIKNIYDQLYKELTTKPFLYENKTKNIIKELVINILRNEKITPKKDIKKIDKSLMMLLNDIDINFANYTLDTASKFMGMNASYFSRFFHNNIGISFSKYLNCVKIENAVKQIQNKKEHKITEIAMNCGFQTIRNFNRIFKEYTGYTPKELPNDYTFNGIKIYTTTNEINPTLSDSKLIEYSSYRN